VVGPTGRAHARAGRGRAGQRGGRGPGGRPLRRAPPRQRDRAPAQRARGGTMGSVKENLEALSASLPDVPTELEALKAQAERVEGAVVDFLNEVGEKDAEAATRLDELKHALVALGHESEGERTQLESQMDSLEERLTAGLGELRDDQGRLADVVE